MDKEKMARIQRRKDARNSIIEFIHNNELDTHRIDNYTKERLTEVVDMVYKEHELTDLKEAFMQHENIDKKENFRTKFAQGE